MALFFEARGGARGPIVGGTAVILHGVPRTTADLDLVVDDDPANLRRLVSVMNRLGYRPRAPFEPAELCDPAARRAWVDDKGMRAFTFMLPDHPLSDIDILIDSPLSYEQLSRSAERIDADGLQLVIASIEHLIEMRRLCGRPQDVADADALRRLLAEPHDG